MGFLDGSRYDADCYASRLRPNVSHCPFHCQLGGGVSPSQPIPIPSGGNSSSSSVGAGAAAIDAAAAAAGGAAAPIAGAVAHTTELT